MADVKHKVERAAFGAAIDGILKYVNKDEEDREKAFLKLVDLSEKFMGNTFSKESYDAARRMIREPDSKWMQYVNRILNEVDPHVIKMSALDYGFEAAFCGKKEINEMRVKHQCNIPWLILMDPTSACNLHCTGCWAAEYGNRLNLSFEDMDRIVTQGKELGIYLYFFTGGEPLVRKDDIIRLCEKHDDCGFHAFTNGTLIDEKFCQDMKRVGNFSVAISLEGFNEVNDLRRGKGVFDKVMHAMDLMKQYGLIFGTSICYTSKNYKVVTSDEFLDSGTGITEQADHAHGCPGDALRYDIDSHEAAHVADQGAHREAVEGHAQHIHGERLRCPEETGNRQGVENPVQQGRHVALVVKEFVRNDAAQQSPEDTGYLHVSHDAGSAHDVIALL